MPRYVILYHELPPTSPRASHWDFMLEHGDALRTWALEAEPRSGGENNAEALADHRREYLTYEGPVSGDRGRVTQWDAGQYELLAATDELVCCQLRGQKLQGIVELTRQNDASNAADQRWMFCFKNK